MFATNIQKEDFVIIGCENGILQFWNPANGQL